MKNLITTLALGIICSLFFTQNVLAQMGIDDGIINGQPEVLNVIGVIDEQSKGYHSNSFDGVIGGQPEVVNVIGVIDGDSKDYHSSSFMNTVGGGIAIDPELEEEVVGSPSPQTAVVFDESLMQQQDWLTPVLQDITIYPMPANDFVFIELEKSADYEINIINMVGQVVSSESVTDTRKHRLDISNLPTGIYLLNFTSGIEMSTKRINVK